MPFYYINYFFIVEICGSWTSLCCTQIAKHTTPMYRTPEMLDLYQNFPISEPQDIWALGCVLYQLCFMTHPFEDSAKLRIINAKYSIPEFDREYTIFHQLIRKSVCVCIFVVSHVYLWTPDLQFMILTNAIQIIFLWQLSPRSRANLFSKY